MKRARRGLITNALANYAGQITTLAVGILLTPLIVSRLGNAMYGVWALVVAVQGLGGLLDLGVTTSVVKYVAEHHARGEVDETSRVVSSSFFLHLGIGTLAFGVTALVAWLGLPFLQLTGGELGVAQGALLIAGASLMLNLPLGVLGSILTGLRHYEISNAVNIVQSLGSAGLIVLALLYGSGPAVLVLINGATLAVAYGVKGYLAFRVLPGLRLSRRMAGWPTLKRIGAYSVWLFLLDLATRVFYNADAVLISAFLPVSNVTAYNLGFKPANAVGYFSGPMVSVFLPAASAMQARDDQARLRRLLFVGTRVALAFALPPILWLAVFGRQIMEVWVGPGHMDALPVMYVFLGVFLVATAQSPAGVILKGVGRVKGLALAVITEYAANVAISIVLIPRVGVVGAALGTLIPALVNDALVIPWLACRAMGIDYREFGLQALVGPVATAVPALALLWPLGVWLSEPTLLTIGVGGLAALLLYGGFYWAFGARREEKSLLTERLKIALGRAPGTDAKDQA